MLYSSSRTSLKDGLGKALFIDDYFFSDIVRHRNIMRLFAHCGELLHGNDHVISQMCL